MGGRGVHTDLGVCYIMPGQWRIVELPKVSLYRQAISLAAVNDAGADVGGACEDCSRPFVVLAEIGSDPIVEVVGFADVQHVKHVWRRFLAKDVGARKRLENLAKLVEAERVGSAADPAENDRWGV